MPETATHYKNEAEAAHGAERDRLMGLIKQLRAKHVGFLAADKKSGTFMFVCEGGYGMDVIFAAERVGARPLVGRVPLPEGVNPCNFRDVTSFVICHAMRRYFDPFGPRPVIYFGQ
jgi:hypothetical protein